MHKHFDSAMFRDRKEDEMDSTLVCLGRNEEWSRAQACRRALVQKRLRLAKHLLELVIIAALLIATALAMGLLPGLKDLLILGLGGAIVAIIIGGGVTYHYSHVPHWR